MAERIFTLAGEYTSSASATFVCRNESHTKVEYYSNLQNGSTEIEFDIGTLPTGSTINSVNFSFTKSTRGSTVESNEFISQEGSSSIIASNDNILEFLKKNPKITINLWTKININYKPSLQMPSTPGDYTTSQCYGSAIYTNIKLIVNYTEPFDTGAKSPTIFSFSLKDTFKNSSYQTMLYTGRVDGLVNNKEQSATISNNCFYKNYSNLSFSSSATSAQSLDPTLTYDLIIRNTSGVTVYEKLNNTSDHFYVNTQIFEKENLNTVIGGFLARSYTFYYSVKDIINKQTTLKGTIYLLDGYTPPSITNFSIKRKPYSGAIDTLLTSIIISAKKIPLSCTSSNSFTYNSLFYKKNSGTTSTPITTTEGSDLKYSITENSDFFSGYYSQTSSYSLSITAYDCCNTITKTVELSPAFSYLNIELNGVSIGARKSSSGSEANPTFEVALPSTFNNDVTFNNEVNVNTSLYISKDSSFTSDAEAYFYKRIQASGGLSVNTSFITQNNTSLQGVNQIICNTNIYGSKPPTTGYENPGQLFFKIID